jgi:hypothetical protein
VNTMCPPYKSVCWFSSSAPSIRLVRHHHMHSRGRSIVIIDVSLGNLPHTKKKDKMEKTSMRFINIFFVCVLQLFTPWSHQENLVSLMRVLLCLYIGATFLHFSGLLVCPPQCILHLLFEEDRLPLFRYCRPCHPKQKFLVRSPVLNST